MGKKIFQPLLISTLAFAVAFTSSAASKKIDNEIKLLADAEVKKATAKKKAARAKRAQKKNSAQNPVYAQQQSQTLTQQQNQNTTRTQRRQSRSENIQRVQFDGPPVYRANPIETVLKREEVEPAEVKELTFNGEVGLSYGQDSAATIERHPLPNISPIIKGSYFEITPSLKFKGQLFSGGVNAKIKDFNNQSLSDNAKENVVRGDLAIDYSLSASVKAQTKVDFENSDSKWPDYIHETHLGMPMRYFQTRISQKLDFDLGMLNLTLNGSFADTNWTTPYIDYNEKHLLGQTVWEKDNQKTVGSARFGFKFSEVFELAATPKISYVKYDQEPARLTNGQKGGLAWNDLVPRREELDQGADIELVLKTDRLNITPFGTAGYVSDEALGANDSSYAGGGIKMSILIDKGTDLKLNGSLNYIKKEFDNWTHSVESNDGKRRDSSKIISAGLSVNITKNVNFGLNYINDREFSTRTSQDMNYTQEITSSTVTVRF